MHDRGENGIVRTVEVLKENGFVTTGSTVDGVSPRYAMINVKGVDIGVIAYTYETPSLDGGVYLNGVRLSSESSARINSFKYEDIDAELVKIKGVVDEAKAAGAEIVVLYYHWGEEYQLAANEWQRYMAEKTVEMMDVDVIFASHPHNLQEAEYVGDVPVFFSTGTHGGRRDTGSQSTGSIGGSRGAGGGREQACDGRDDGRCREPLEYHIDAGGDRFVGKNRLAGIAGRADRRAGSRGRGSF